MLSEQASWAEIAEKVGFVINATGQRRRNLIKMFADRYLRGYYDLVL